MKELQTAESGLAGAKALMSTYDNYVRLEKTEIPKIEAEIKAAASKLAEANKGVDQVLPLVYATYLSALRSSVN